MNHTLHIVCGLPAVGKTTYSTALAAELKAAFIDSDTASDTLIQAAHRAADLDPHDRDSPLYKKTYREPVYDTLFALAHQNLPHIDVIIAGPFTSELENREAWQNKLSAQMAPYNVKIHHLTLPEAERLTRMQKRGALRDQAKLR